MRSFRSDKHFKIKLLSIRFSPFPIVNVSSAVISEFYGKNGHQALARKDLIHTGNGNSRRGTPIGTLQIGSIAHGIHTDIDKRDKELVSVPSPRSVHLLGAPRPDKMNEN